MKYKYLQPAGAASGCGHNPQGQCLAALNDRQDAPTAGGATLFENRCKLTQVATLQVSQLDPPLAHPKKRGGMLLRPQSRGGPFRPVWGDLDA